jgi:hypothetical protein
MAETDYFLLILYLINVNQPVSSDALASEYENFLRGIPRLKSEARLPFEEVVARLIKDGSALVQGGLYSITLHGLRKIAASGLDRSRDKNRLFLLKTLLYK